MPAGGLRRVAIGGAAWQGGSYVVGKLLLLLTTVVLARILTPGDFGVVALALVFIGYADILTDFGVAEALVYFAEDERRDDVALTMSLVASAGLTLLGVLAAPVIGAFFHRPDAVTMIRVLSISLFLGGTAEVPEALLRKRIRFGRRIVANIARVVGQGLISIALAAAGFGAWSLVWGYLAGDLIWSGVAWALVDYRPRLGFWRMPQAIARPMIRYGVPVAANGLLLSFVFDVDYLIVGRRLGATQLGFYTLAFRIPDLAIVGVFVMLSMLTFPMFALVRSDPARLRRGYLTAVKVQTLYGLTAGALIAVTAPVAVVGVFGARWAPAVVPLEALALYGAFRSIGIGAVDVLKAIGRPGIAFALGVVRLVAVVPALLVAVGYGIDGVAWAQAIVALMLSIGMQALALRLLGSGARDAASALAPSIAVAAGAAGVAVLVRAFAPGPPLAVLALAGAAGLLAAVVIAAALEREVIRSVLGSVRARGGAGAATEDAPVTPGAEPARG